MKNVREQFPDAYTNTLDQLEATEQGYGYE